MTTFIHLSDLHIRGSNRKEENINCTKIVEHIIKRYTGRKPTILLSGDIVDDGKKTQYKNAVEILKPLVKSGFKVLAVPGNHDYGPYGNFYTERSQAYFQEFILGNLIGQKNASKPSVTMEDIYPYSEIIDGILFMGLDSVVGNEDEFAHFASGEIGRDQLERASNILKNHTERQSIVFMHHHPFFRKLGLELDDAQDVLRMLASRTNILCFGHKHASQIWYSENGIDCIIASGKSTKRNSSYQFQFREIKTGKQSFEVNMVSFRND